MPSIFSKPFIHEDKLFEAMCKALLQSAEKSMNPVQQQCMQKTKERGEIKFGSDCSGADSAFTSGSIWCKGCGIIPSNEMASEAPFHQGGQSPCQLMAMNHGPKFTFIDVMTRTMGAYELFSGRRVPVPRDLDFYSAGSVCVDFCNDNIDPKQFPCFPGQPMFVHSIDLF